MTGVLVSMNLNRRALLTSLFFCGAAAFAQEAAAPKRTPDVPYVPTPQTVVEAMLKLGEVKKGDVLAVAALGGELTVGESGVYVSDAQTLRRIAWGP